MAKPRLYIFVGYPGAGKTSVAHLISDHGAGTHLWADHERKKLFEDPTYSAAESDELYAKLNAAAAYLLDDKRSVVFDTNFNFRRDRDLMRSLAQDHNAELVLIWVTTPLKIARSRAVDGSAGDKHRVLGTMTEKEFATNTAKLEEPGKDETTIKIDGTKLDEKAALAQLGLT